MLFQRLGGKFSKWGEILPETYQEMLHVINPSLGGVKEIQVIGCELHFEQQMAQQGQKHATAATFYLGCENLPRILIETCLMVFLVLFISISQIFSKGSMQDIILVLGVFADPQAVKYWADIFQSTYDGYINTVWDYQWTFPCCIQNALGILSNVNLVANVGFWIESTHTANQESQYANLSTDSIEFPLKHARFMVRDRKVDEFMQNTLFQRNWLQRFKAQIKNKL
jgi:hypothetical protein